MYTKLGQTTHKARYGIAGYTDSLANRHFMPKV
jgi:hypothetical protein